MKWVVVGLIGGCTLWFTARAGPHMRLMYQMIRGGVNRTETLRGMHYQIEFDQDGFYKLHVRNKSGILELDANNRNKD